MNSFRHQIVHVGTLSNLVEPQDKLIAPRHRRIRIHLLNAFIINNLRREIRIDSRCNEFHFCKSHSINTILPFQSGVRPSARKSKR